MAEIITCAKCARKLQVPEDFFGQTVQCPECQHRFVAVSASVSAQPLPVAPLPPRSRRVEEDEPPHRYDPLRRRSRYDDDGDEDDYDDGRRIRQYYKAHRGGLIMALGLASLVGGLSICVPVLLGPVAWAMGSYDLREIRAGRMDPSGESMTRSGQICGIIATIFMVLGGLLVLLMILLDEAGF